MQAHRGPSNRLVIGLAVLCLALLGWTYLGFVIPFRAAAAGRELLDVRISGYEAGDVLSMLDFLRGHPDAAAIQHSLYLGPELVFPALLTMLLILLLRLARPGGSFFGRQIPAAVISAIFLLPVLYGFADYAENIASLQLFPPSTPSDATVAALSHALPIFVRLKFAALAITIILFIRFAVLRNPPSEAS
jgi:hypothetical protein